MLQGFSDADFDFESNRVQYPEEIKARAPRGLRARVRDAAEVEGVSMGEFIRRALTARVEATQPRAHQGR
jgi:predicted HicB family RNase H-like nuclease